MTYKFTVEEILEFANSAIFASGKIPEGTYRITITSSKDSVVFEFERKDDVNSSNRKEEKGKGHRS